MVAFRSLNKLSARADDIHHGKSFRKTVCQSPRDVCSHLLHFVCVLSTAEVSW
jgi:hypothetical protein